MDTDRTGGPNASNRSHGYIRIPRWFRRRDAVAVPGTHDALPETVAGFAPEKKHAAAFAPRSGPPLPSDRSCSPTSQRQPLPPPPPYSQDDRAPPYSQLSQRGRRPTLPFSSPSPPMSFLDRFDDALTRLDASTVGGGGLCIAFMLAAAFYGVIELTTTRAPGPEAPKPPPEDSTPESSWYLQTFQTVWFIANIVLVVSGLPHLLSAGSSAILALCRGPLLDGLPRNPVASAVGSVLRVLFTSALGTFEAILVLSVFLDTNAAFASARQMRAPGERPFIFGCANWYFSVTLLQPVGAWNARAVFGIMAAAVGWAAAAALPGECWLAPACWVFGMAVVAGLVGAVALKDGGRLARAPETTFRWEALLYAALVVASWRVPVGTICSLRLPGEGDRYEV